MVDQDAILELIGRINDAWGNRRTAGLRDLFHESMVFVRPDLAGRIQGREACIKSDDDFPGDGLIEARLAPWRVGSRPARLHPPGWPLVGRLAHGPPQAGAGGKASS